MAMDSVPEAYLDVWARLQCQRPHAMPEDRWRRDIDDAGRFLDQWGSRALAHGWMSGDLFDGPRDGRLGVLAWAVEGGTVQAIGRGPCHDGKRARVRSGSKQSKEIKCPARVNVSASKTD